MFNYYKFYFLITFNLYQSDNYFYIIFYLIIFCVMLIDYTGYIKNKLE